MAKIQINNVVVLNNPALFSSPLQFEITFDCTENLEVSYFIDLKSFVHFLKSTISLFLLV